MLDGQYWWSRFNVAASPFYSGAVFRMGLSVATFTGLSLLLLVYAALGVLFGLWFRPRTFLGTWARALVVALVWHVVADRWFWPLITPYARVYFSPAVMLAGHAVWALLLLRYPSRYRALDQTFGAGNTAAEEEPEQVGGTGVVSAVQTPDSGESGEPSSEDRVP